MIVTIHQPEYLPYLGFLDKADQADVLVLLDCVQYKTNNWQNRNRVLGSHGVTWLTVPVLHRGHTSRTIREMRINNAVSWGRKHWLTAYYSYQNHPFFAEYASFFQDTWTRHWERIAELDEYVLRYLCDVMGIRTRLVRASDLAPKGSRSHLLLDICQRLKADAYLAGVGARDYLDYSIFHQAGVTVLVHCFQHPVYPQHGQSDFISHLSSLDLLMNCGPESVNIIRFARQPARVIAP